MLRTIVAVTIISAVSISMGTGCLAVVAGGAAGGTMYVKGDLETTLEAPMTKAATATEKALNKMQLKKISAEHDSLTGEFIYRSVSDKKITVKLKRQTDMLTEINIRVGIMGDETLSQNIYDMIQKELR
jgi:hypothetical protein